MPTIASVQLTDLGARRTVSSFGRVKRLEGRVDGLRHVDVAGATPLEPRAARVPRMSRLAVLAWWEDEAALDAFLATRPLGGVLQTGWHARLEPLRAHGSWPGLPDDIARSRRTEYDGPSVVLTLGRLRIPQAVRFLRTSAKAEAAAIAAPGMVWGTAMAKPPFVATCSLWRSVDALSAYAYGSGHGGAADIAIPAGRRASDAGHPDAIAADRARPFHQRSAFVRFRPLRIEGSLDGTNPLPEGALAAAR